MHIVRFQPHALLRQARQIRHLVRRAVPRHIGPAEVIRQEENDVWPRGDSAALAEAKHNIRTREELSSWEIAFLFQIAQAIEKFLAAAAGMFDDTGINPPAADGRRGIDFVAQLIFSDQLKA